MSNLTYRELILTRDWLSNLTYRGLILTWAECQIWPTGTWYLREQNVKSDLQGLDTYVSKLSNLTYRDLIPTRAELLIWPTRNWYLREQNVKSDLPMFPHGIHRGHGCLCLYVIALLEMQTYCRLLQKFHSWFYFCIAIWEVGKTHKHKTSTKHTNYLIFLSWLQ